MTRFPRVEPLGDSALLMTLGEGRDLRLTRCVARLVGRLREAMPTGVQDLVPAYAALAVLFDPTVADPRLLGEVLRSAALHVLADGPSPTESGERRTHRIPVRYDGPDLAEVAERAGISPADVVLRHAGPSYDVLFLGFVPGFAYLGPLDQALVLPRRAAPRRRVPAGSVGIAGAQTGIYPLESPGGWHLIGHTEATLFDPGRDPPNLLVPGDRVRFVPADP